MTGQPTDDSNDQAHELLIEFLGLSHRDTDAEFEALCAAHPAAADELRSLFAEHRGMQELLGVFGQGREDSTPASQPDGARVGDVVGDFELLSRIAHGGQGEVWEARQRSLERRVALKLVLPYRINEKTLALFAREARAGGRLSHPGIVAVYGYGEDDGRHWIAQEFVDGAWTLRDFIDAMRNEAELPVDYYRAVAVFVAELADALQAAHEAGVIHRDVKPQNVLVTATDHPKLSDFGLARLTDESAMSLSGAVAGTWLYMSPEQVTAKNKELDHRTDIFSLGVVMYEMLALVRPFDGDTTHQVAESIVQRDPPDIRKMRSKVPRDLAVICGKALEKATRDRYQTMGELAADLRRHLADEAIHAAPPALLERGVKWVRRNRAKSLAGAVAATAFVVISGLAMSLEMSNRALASKTAEAEANAGEAQRKALDVMRLSLAQDHDDLVLEADSLWPAWPDEIPRLEDWKSRAEALVAELPALKAKREELRDAPALEDQGSRLRWWSHMLDGLIADLEGLLAPDVGLLTPDGVHPDHGWSVPRRLAFAERLRAGFLPGGEFLLRWESAATEIKTAYPGLDLPVQIGLVPIGVDPNSKLWEFWHVASGTEPLRGEDGRLDVEESSGLMFVLLPGGKYWMGTQSADPKGRNYDTEAEDDTVPVHEVELSTFFLSKYEMTQGQWLRLAGANPSRFSPAQSAGNLQFDLTHPVERVSWFEINDLLDRVELRLPSEAQWEYGARAGTETPWWTGQDRESLRLEGAVNLADQAMGQVTDHWAAIDDWPEMNDGFAVHGPVDGLAPNAFGLHHVHGNLWEWCEDVYATDFYGRSSGVDPVYRDEESASRVSRGGSYAETAARTRSSHRSYDLAHDAMEHSGLRPAREVWGK